jgi:hypothetical protein
MVDIDTYRELALSFPDTVELPHFGNPSFRVKKGIFCTYWTKDHRAMLRLTLADQEAFCSYDKSVFFPVHGSWGRQGATFVELNKVGKDVFKAALTAAYTHIASKK